MPFRVELPRLCKIIFVLISIFMLFILIVHLLHLQALYSRQRCTCRARMNRVHNVSRKLDELCRTAVRMVTVQRCSQSITSSGGAATHKLGARHKRTSEYISSPCLCLTNNALSSFTTRLLHHRFHWIRYLPRRSRHCLSGSTS